jgi:SAM-dependent methyltransferase
MDPPRSGAHGGRNCTASRHKVVVTRDMHDSGMTDTDLPGLTEHEAQNRASWNADSDDYQARHGEQLAASTGLAWGVMQIPEAELRILGDVAGKDILELGCGAAQWSIALARLGARPVGIDLSERQLEHARRLMADGGVDFPLIHGSAERVPLPDASFDIVFCDHGAMTFADPYRTVPEAARLLRRGGLFAFSHHTPIEAIAWPLDSDKVGDRLVVDYFGMHRLDDGETTTFQLAYGEWIRLFRANGLGVEDLIEPRPADDATSSYRTEEELAWARRWPAEEIWRVRKA